MGNSDGTTVMCETVIESVTERSPAGKFILRNQETEVRWKSGGISWGSPGGRCWYLFSPSPSTGRLGLYFGPVCVCVCVCVCVVCGMHVVFGVYTVWCVC